MWDGGVLVAYKVALPLPLISFFFTNFSHQQSSSNYQTSGLVDTANHSPRLQSKYALSWKPWIHFGWAYCLFGIKVPQVTSEHGPVFVPASLVFLHKCLPLYHRFLVSPMVEIAWMEGHRCGFVLRLYGKT